MAGRPSSLSSGAIAKRTHHVVRRWASLGRVRSPKGSVVFETAVAGERLACNFRTTSTHVSHSWVSSRWRLRPQTSTPRPGPSASSTARTGSVLQVAHARWAAAQSRMSTWRQGPSFFSWRAQTPGITTSTRGPAERASCPWARDVASSSPVTLTAAIANQGWLACPSGVTRTSWIGRRTRTGATHRSSIATLGIVTGATS
mmetsp:Transcript_102131/g.255943  ORF Transcript_102131/g.255943 Transcript_102131/m.255943 type:complete len:201 (+) Transcript_102131:254-856(+)